MEQRIYWVDNLKGLAMLLVMLSHGCVLPVVGQYLYACYMPVFFIVSGYTFSWKPKETLYRWTKNKAKRLLIPYFIYGFLTVTLYNLIKALFVGFDLKIFIYDIGGIIYSRHHIFTNSQDSMYIMSGVNAPLWFLTAMFVSWILFIILYKANTHLQYVLISFYLIISCLALYLPILLPWSIDTAFIGAIFIWTGSRIRNVNISKLKKGHFLIFGLIALTIYLFATYYNGNVNMSIRNYGNMGILSIFLFLCIGFCGTLIYALISIAFGKGLIGKFLVFIGKNSLTILCSHMFVFITINMLVEIIGINISEFILVSIQILTSLISVWIIKKIFNLLKVQIPIVNYL